MGSIDSTAVWSRFTQDIIGELSITAMPTTFLLNKFKKEVKQTLYLAYMVERYGEYMASDVPRQSDGTFVQFTDFTWNIETPPYWYLWMNIMQMEGYNRVFGVPFNSLNVGAYNDFIDRTIKRFKQLWYMVLRRREYMVSQIYTTGVITTAANGSTDVLRKPESIIAYDASIDWTQPGVDPTAILDKAGVFIRTVGKSMGAILDCTLGDAAYKALRDNPIIQSRSQKLWNVIATVDRPVAKADGSRWVGQIDTGQFTMDMYVYPQFYTESTEIPNTSKPYIPSNAVIVTAKEPNFVDAYSMVPMLPQSLVPGNLTAQGQWGIGGADASSGMFYVQEYVDIKRTAWELSLKSAGLPFVLNPDEIFTAFVTPI